MPYIPQARRDLLGLEGMASEPGDLAYVVYREALSTLGIDPVTGFLRPGKKAPTFAQYAAVLGAIEGAKLEIYRRLVAKYEDLKIDQNGDLPGAGGPQ